MDKTFKQIALVLMVLALGYAIFNVDFSMKQSPDQLQYSDFLKKVTYDLDDAAMRDPKMLEAFKILEGVKGLPDAGSPSRDWNITAGLLINGKAAFMVNYVVEDLHAVIEALRSEGCDVDPKVEESEFGKFGWVMDPEGNRIELWQPPDTPAL